MSNNWLELREATQELDMELEYLCELVINGQVRTTTDKDRLLIDLTSVPIVDERDNLLDAEQYDSLEQEVESLKLECAWLKSENMRSDRIINEYFDKFTDLKKIQEELVQIINQQSEIIRELKGYSKPKKQNIKKVKPKRNSVLSLWMFFPIAGLFLTAFIEVVRTYQISNVSDFLKLIGVV